MGERNSWVQLLVKVVRRSLRRCFQPSNICNGMHNVGRRPYSSACGQNVLDTVLHIVCLFINNTHVHLYRRLISATICIFDNEQTSHKVDKCVAMFEQVQLSYSPLGEPFSVDSPLGEHSTSCKLISQRSRRYWLTVGVPGSKLGLPIMLLVK